MSLAIEGNREYREIVSHIRVAASKTCFLNSYGSPHERFGLDILPLLERELTDCGKSPGDIRVIFTLHALPDRDRPIELPTRFKIVAQPGLHVGEVVHASGENQVIALWSELNQPQCPFVKNAGSRVVALEDARVCQVVEIAPHFRMG